jgi:glutathione S-transferase
MAAQSRDSRPVLWHLSISHYSEKARWALEHKRIDHSRRALPPGIHMAFALGLTGGVHATLPVLQLDGRAIGDSTTVIAALEERYPDRPVYPRDPEQRRRALELEDFFDERLGPHARLLPFHHLVGEPELMAELAIQAVPGSLKPPKGLVGAYARRYASLRFGVNDGEAAVAAEAGIRAALDRLEAELAGGEGEFLVGEQLSVADITAASLFGPIVAPAGGPIPPDQPVPAALERFRDELRDRAGFIWVEETFRKHRRRDRGDPRQELSGLAPDR